MSTTLVSEPRPEVEGGRITTMVIRIGWALTCCVLAYLRLAGVTNQSFQAFAHFVVGGLFGAWAIGLTVQRRYNVRVAPGFYGWLALATSLVELYAFLMGIGKIEGEG